MVIGRVATMVREHYVTYSVVKRAIDIAVAASVLPVALPAIGLAAGILRAQGPGPVFYQARRIGQGGRPFTLYKLRTMRLAATGPGVTAFDDPRVTGIGRWIRHAKIDEICQLINVLRGDMSLVGPRPEDPRYVALYSARQRGVLSVKPGMTSAASVLFRDEESFFEGIDAGGIEDHYVLALMPAKLEMDLAYVDSRSTLEDLRILLKTARAMFS
jgi:lipopolysaccharide/colanic/teichoic acid biosynthesis glycosyltransferase